MADDFDSILSSIQSGSPIGGTSLAADPILAQLFADLPPEAMALLNPMQQVAAEQTAQYTPMPRWTRGLNLPHPEKSTTDNPNSPFTAAWVYLGTKTRDKRVATDMPASGDFGPDEFRSGGVSDATFSTKQVEKDVMRTLAQAQAMPYGWDEQEVNDAMKRMQAAGLEVSTFDDVVSVWEGLTHRAAMTFSVTKGDKKLTPWDVLDMAASEVAAAAGAAAAGEPDPNRREVQVHKTINEISEGQAWSTLRGTMSQMLGRDPSDNELRDFTHRMGRMAASNPSISRTVAQYKDGQVASTRTTSKQGFTMDDAAQNAYEAAQNDADYAEYQSATTYFNALQTALGPIGG